MDDLVVLETFASQTEADLVCSILEDEGIRCFQRQTNFAAGMTDAFPSGGPREVVVRGEDVVQARSVLEQQRRSRI